MYGIIYWEGEQGDESTGNKPLPYVDEDGAMIMIPNIEDAEKIASEIEKGKGIDARVISLDEVIDTTI